MTTSGESGVMQMGAGTVFVPQPSYADSREADGENRAADLEALAQQVNRMLSTRRPVRRATLGAADGEDRAADLEALAMQVNRMLERKRPVQREGGNTGEPGTGLLRRTGWRKLWAR